MENVGKSESVEQYNAEAPLVGGIRLDFGRIKEKHNGKLTITGESGKSILIKVESDNIYIELVSEPDIHFGAKLEKNNDGKNLIEFDIRTKGQESLERASDFHARELANTAMEYFSKENDIYGIKFRWLDYSDEHKKYFDLKNKFLTDLGDTQTHTKEVPVEAQKLAALETWTGKFATSKGFSEVYVEETNETEGLPDSEPIPMVIGYFMKNPRNLR